MPESEQAAPCCEGCGTYMPIIEELQDKLALKQDLIDDQQKRLRILKGTVSRLQADRDTARELDPHYGYAVSVFEYWKVKLAPRAKEFSGKRFEAVRDRLRAGHSVEELKLAVDGCALRPYVTDHGRAEQGRKDQREVELELICRTEAHLTRFQRYAEAKQAETGDEADLIPAGRLAQLQSALDQPAVLARLRELRGWKAEVCLSLGLGLEDGRVVFPIYDADGKLSGVCRYAPNGGRRDGPKMLGEGKRDLFPPPEQVDATTCWLVEGEPDAVAVRSAGLPAVAVPGVQTWKKGWAERFAKFDRVYVCFDADDAGRTAADKRAQALAEATTAQIVEIAPTRSDGYDVSDLLLEQGESTSSRLASLAASRSSSVTKLRPREEPEFRDPPFERICEELERADCRPRQTQPGHVTARCPCHDDRTPSLSVTEGDDGRVLITCHAGCEREEVVRSLGLEWRDLFPPRRSYG